MPRCRLPARRGGFRLRAAGSLNTLDSRSPYGGGEVDVLVTVERPQGLFYIVFIAPKAEFEKAQAMFEEVLRSVRFR